MEIEDFHLVCCWFFFFLIETVESKVHWRRLPPHSIKRTVASCQGRVLRLIPVSHSTVSEKSACCQRQVLDLVFAPCENTMQEQSVRHVRWRMGVETQVCAPWTTSVFQLEQQLCDILFIPRWMWVFVCLFSFSRDTTVYLKQAVTLTIPLGREFQNYF